MAQSAIITYTGTPLPTGSTTNILFSTVAAFPGANYLAQTGMKRLQLDLFVSQNGVLNWYKSPDRGNTWHQLSTQAITASGTSSSTLDILCEEYADFKIEWVNGGVTQTVFDISMALSDERNKGT